MTEIRLATHEDLLAIDALRRAEQEAVGFLPLSRYEREVESRRRTLWVLSENGDVVAYLLWTRGWPVATVQQLVVRDDARRIQRATALVDRVRAEMLRQHRYGVTCRVRADLAAVLFWRALGFREVRREASGRRGPCIRFYQGIGPTLFDLGDYLRSAAPGMMQRRGFRLSRTEDPRK